MREFKDEITNDDMEKIYEALTKFDSYISSVTKKQLLFKNN